MFHWKLKVVYAGAHGLRRGHPLELGNFPMKDGN